MPSQNKKARRLAFCAVFTALSMILSYVDSLIPLVPQIPGIKLGLANLVIVFALFTFGIPEAVVINLARVLLTGFTFTGMTGLLYSLSGAFLSLALMCILKKTGRFSVIGISMAGGVFHNLGQLLCACLMVSDMRLLAYYPVLALSGTITGILMGALAYRVIGRMKDLRSLGFARDDKKM